MFEKQSEIKEHINIEHRQKSTDHYSFCYWNMHAKNKFENEIHKNLLRINPKDWWNQNLVLWRKFKEFKPNNLQDFHQYYN